MANLSVLIQMNLNAINYLHFGAPKAWYAVAPASTQRFELLAEANFQTDAAHCDQFLRHKNYVLSPTLCAANSIKLARAIQQPGDFVITLPAVYHSGFNHGFNCAEAINFALPNWMMAGRMAAICECSKTNVHINMDIFSLLFRRSKWAQPGNAINPDGPVQLPGEPAVTLWEPAATTSEESDSFENDSGQTISGARNMTGSAAAGSRNMSGSGHKKRSQSEMTDNISADDEVSLRTSGAEKRPKTGSDGPAPASVETPLAFPTGASGPAALATGSLSSSHHVDEVATLVHQVEQIQRQMREQAQRVRELELQLAAAQDQSAPPS